MVQHPSVSELHLAACRLYEAGFSVIPIVPGSKRPTVNWTRFQHRRATISDINSWWSARSTDAPSGLGVVVGSISKAAVLDIDPEPGYTAEELIAEAEQAFGHNFPPTCCVGTCGGSYHYHYSISEPLKTTIIYQSNLGKIELRGDGAVVVMPPSVAYSKRTGKEGVYDYVVPLESRIALESTWLYQLAPGQKQETNIPTHEQIKATVQQHYKHLSARAQKILSGQEVPDDRSKQCYHLACELIRSGIKDQRTLATLIMAAPYHQHKYGTRPKNSAWGEWGHALTLATRTLEEVPLPQGKKQPNKVEHTFPFLLVPLANVTPEQPKFLINPYLPLGEATILDGDPGLGKTWAWMALAAGLTGSKICPVPHDTNAKRDAKIVILTAEDSISKTVRNRLEWLGANLNHIYVFVPNAALPNGTITVEQPTAEYIEQALQSIAQIQPDMVVIDPLTLYAATEKDFNSDKATDVRRMLLRLVTAARQMNFALVLCRHYRKAAGKAIYRGAGSIDFTATVRSVLSFGLDAASGERLFVHTKANLTACGPAQAFTLNQDATPPFRWLGTRADINPDMITGDSAASEAADEKTKLDDAISYCEEMLGDGPVLAQTILEKGRKLGISERTLRRARDRIGIVSYSTGFGKDKKFYWALGNSPPENP